MLKRFRSKSRTVLGIDLSPTAIKVIEISLQDAKPCIEAYAYHSFPSNIKESAKNDELTAVLKKLLLGINSTAKYAAIALPDSMVISKTIQLVASLNDSEREELAIHEANKSLFSSEEISIDFTVLGASSEFAGMLDILLVISKAENINKPVKAIRNAGVEVKVVELESHALARAIGRLISQNKVIGIIDLGYQLIRLCFINNERILYTREEEVFGNQQFFDVFQQTSLAQSARQNTLLDRESELIVLHIKRNLQFFFANSHHENVEQIYLVGERSNLVQLSKLIQEAVKISTQVANPLNGLIVAKDLNVEELTQLGPSFSVAIGLALRAIAC
ncbi:Tfp pilus assembly protein, ATPase PilM [Legionella nautarum]|uniref:Tfp pilus assembly protein, ATPase PilM n=1 Tax=Legionella nautarum TaxID=45070 RepID=A0A0W0X413_9GAMM|nr:type IV pilus assembly protein PilM [Legionella nautarum]KTD39326.1 Tfp pilus assembly protein, ATPase PilM [Legionella nautarum]